MADPLDVTRIDALPGRSPRDGVDPLRRPADRERQKRRRSHQDQHPDPEEGDDAERQVGTRLDVRA